MSRWGGGCRENRFPVLGTGDALPLGADRDGPQLLKQDPAFLLPRPGADTEPEESQASPFSGP